MEIHILTRFRFLLFSTRCGRVEYLKLLLYSSPSPVCCNFRLYGTSLLYTAVNDQYGKTIVDFIKI